MKPFGFAHLSHPGRILALVGTLASGLSSSVAQAADLQLITLVKGRAYQQLSADALTSLPEEPYYFAAIVWTVSWDVDAASAVSLRRPGGLLTAMEKTGTGWEWEQLFTEQAAFEAAYPDAPAEPYAVLYTGKQDGPQTVSLTFGGEGYPNAPRLINFDAAQGIDSDSEFTLHWEPMAGADADDIIVVTLERSSDGSNFYSTGLPGDPSAIPGTVTSRTLPRGLLDPGTSYRLNLLFARVVDTVSLGPNGELAVAGYSAETQVPLTTMTQPTSTELRFAFAVDEGILPDSVAGTAAAAYPWPLYGRYAVHFVVDDAGSRPDHVLFGGPPGIGLDEVLSAGAWDFLGPTVRIYTSPEQPNPPYPPGGSYWVEYQQQRYDFHPPTPDRDAAETVIRPSVPLHAGQFNRVDWDFLDLDGNLIAAPPAFTGLTLRIESDTGQLFHQDNLPMEPRTKQLPAALAWSGVRRITLIARDETGNLYHSAAVRREAPVLFSSALPDAIAGQAYSVVLTGAGGRPPYTWSYLGGDPIPQGLQLSADGGLTGVPIATGLAYFDVRLTDAQGQSATANRVLRVTPPGTPDVHHYLLDLQRIYRQRSTDPYDIYDHLSKARFQGRVYGTSAASVTRAELIHPQWLSYGLRRTFYQNSDLVYLTESTNASDLESLFRTGLDYTFSLNTARDGERDLPLTGPGGGRPPIPLVSNWVELQFAPITGSLMASWSPWLTDDDSGFIYAELQDADGRRRSSSGLPPLPFAMNGGQTAVGFGLDTIHPPLEPGQAYRLQVTFTWPSDWRDPDSNPDYPGVIGMTGISTTTEVPVVTQMNYPTWRDRVFAPADLNQPSVVDPLRDPDQDGWINLVEFAVGGSPTNPDAGPLITVAADPAGVVLTYPRQAGAIGVEVGLETTSDLAQSGSWQPLSAALHPEHVTVHWYAPDDSLQRQVRTRVIVDPYAGPRFFRLRIREEDL